MSENLLSKTAETSLLEVRRGMITRGFGRAKKLGLPIEESSEFEGWLEEWVRGEIDTPTLRNRYIELLRMRDRAFRMALDARQGSL